MMRSMKWMLVVVVSMVASSLSAGNVTYSKWAANRYRVMIMDETGANPTEIYAGPKFSPYRPSPTISPPAPGGAWIAWSEGALYKVREDGTDLMMVLCDGHDGGAYSSTDPYLSVLDAQWSPSGTEILVETLQTGGSTHLGLLPAEFTVGADCALTDLALIYDGMAAGFGIEGTAAWNDDGSQIAFFEIDGPWYEGGVIRLVVLERQVTGEWEAQIPPIYPPGLTGVYPLDLDWQRGGSVAAFTSRQETGRDIDFWLTWIDTATGAWGYLTEGGNRLAGTSPSWSPDSPDSPDGSRLIFSNDRAKLVEWTGSAVFDGEGSTEVIGSGTEPDWQREPLQVPCTLHSECPDDNNICTSEICDGFMCTWVASRLACDDQDRCTRFDQCDTNGECIGVPIPEEDPCEGEGPSGICCAGDCVEELSCNVCVPTHSREKGPRCIDGIDNDCDGWIDGYDPDC